MIVPADRGALRALWVQGEDLAQSEPHQRQVVRALRRLDLLVVQDLFLTETTELAHVVLPAAGWLEQEGTFTNAERRVQRVRRALPPPGEARPDGEVVRDVGRALGAAWSHEGPAQVLSEVAKAAPALFGGLRLDRLEPDDTLLACSDGLWHYFSPLELGAIVHALQPREAGEMLLSKARQRARGGGDNISLAIVRVERLL